MVSMRFLSFILLQLVVSTLATLWQRMPIGNNINFAYLDTGPVPLSNKYTTYVFVHGMGFNSAIYSRLFLFAWINNVRVVAVNRRDYQPTSPLTPAELAVLSNGDAGSRTYFKQRGVELGLFLDAFVKANNIPKPNSQRQGGIVLTGWSLGCVTTHALLANLDSLPTATINRLSPLLHTFLMHDAGATAMGFPNPPEYDISLWFEPNPTIRFNLFKKWATGYYEHTDSSLTTGNPSTLEYNNADPSKPHSLDDTPSLLQAPMLDAGAFAGSETNVLYISEPEYRNLIKQALFNTTMASYLPKARVRYFHGGETPGVLVSAVWSIMNTAANPGPFCGGVPARNVNYYRARQGNHFIFYDRPQYALDQFAAAVAV